MLIFQICLRHRDMSTLRHVARFVRPYRRLSPYRAPTNWWPSPHRLSFRSLGAQRKPQNRWKTWCYRMLSLSWNIILLGCDQLLIFSEFARNRFMSVVPFLGNFEWSRRQLKMLFCFEGQNPSSNQIWLVGQGHPSEKYERQLGWLFPIYGKIENGNQTTNQRYLRFFWSCSSCFLLPSFARVNLWH